MQWVQRWPFCEPRFPPLCLVLVLPSCCYVWWEWRGSQVELLLSHVMTCFLCTPIWDILLLTSPVSPALFWRWSDLRVTPHSTTPVGWPILVGVGGRSLLLRYAHMYTQLVNCQAIFYSCSNCSCFKHHGGSPWSIKYVQFFNATFGDVQFGWVVLWAADYLWRGEMHMMQLRS